MLNIIREGYAKCSENSTISLYPKDSYVNDVYIYVANLKRDESFRDWRDKKVRITIEEID